MIILVFCFFFFCNRRVRTKIFFCNRRVRTKIFFCNRRVRTKIWSTKKWFHPFDRRMTELISPCFKTPPKRLIVSPLIFERISFSLIMVKKLEKTFWWETFPKKKFEQNSKKIFFEKIFHLSGKGADPINLLEKVGKKTRQIRV